MIARCFAALLLFTKRSTLAIVQRPWRALPVSWTPTTRGEIRRADGDRGIRLSGMATTKSPATKTTKPAAPKAGKSRPPAAEKAPGKARKPAAPAAAPKGKQAAPAAARHPVARMSAEDIAASRHRHLRSAAAVASDLCGLRQKFLFAAFDGELRREAGVEEWEELGAARAYESMEAASKLDVKLSAAVVRRLTGLPTRPRLSGEAGTRGASP